MLKKLLIRFLAAGARRAILREKPSIVAITGSFGKSSVKEAVAIALGASEPGSRIRASVKNYNNEFGLPFTIFSVSAPGRDPLKWAGVLFRALWIGWGLGRTRVHAFVLEMGADRKGDLGWLVRIARPNVAVVSAVGEAHSEYFGSLEEIAREKATIVRSLPADGFAVLNNDDANVTAMRRETKADTAYFGFSEGSDIQIIRTAPAVTSDEEGRVLPLGIDVALSISGQVFELRLRGTIGLPQAAAAAAALAVARHFDIAPETAIARLEKDYHGIAGRTRIIPGIKKTTIIDDSYNAASPKTVVSALRDLATLPLTGVQRRIAVLGEMRELGSYSDGAHRDAGRAVVENGIDFLVACGTLARGIAEAAAEAGMDGANIRLFDASPEAGRFVQDLIRPGDVILVKGSQGMRMERIVKEIMAEPTEAPFLLVRQTEDWVGK
jgi:UDP-N-acetylmuramoyl-tripeptide--D-alanyl-D-alanine ligase